MLTVIGLKVICTGILFICDIREISLRHGWLLVDNQSINKKELTLERPTGLVGPLQEMISLYFKNNSGYYAETS